MTAPLIKLLTGGVDQLEARFLYQENFEFTPGFKVFMASNHLPAFRQLDEALEQRIVPIPFSAVIPKEERNANLAERLKGELPGILNWAIDGLQRVLVEGIERPWEVRKLLFRYKITHNAVQRFLNDSCDFAPKYEAGSHELYDRYRRYCEIAGEGKPMMRKSFLQRIEGDQYERRRKRGGMRILGLRIKEDSLLARSWGVDVSAIKGEGK